MPPAGLHDLRSDLVTLRRAVEAMILRVEEAMAGPDAPAPAGAVLDDDLIDLATAAQHLRKSKEATRRWLRRNGLRKLVAGRVYVRETRLRAHLASRLS